MRIYISFRYDRREEMAAIAERLRASGHAVTSGWLAGLDGQGSPMTAAIGSISDLAAAECCLSFSEDPAAAVPWAARGGRHVELGYALATGMRMVVVGPRENVFHHLPCVEVYATADQAIETLSGHRGSTP